MTENPISKVAVLVGLGLVIACGPSPTNEFYEIGYTETREPCQDRDPLRRAYFGDLHVHTALSFDAFTQDVRGLPADAYRFARGDQVLLPPLDANGNPTVPLSLERPLDFAAVTDHSEFLGEVDLCQDPTAPAYSSSQCSTLRQAQGVSTFTFGVELTRSPPERFSWCGTDGSTCTDRALSIWGQIQQATDDAYDATASCQFTTFHGYEWSGAPGISNLHRNVIFRNAYLPAAPISYFDQPSPEGLWTDIDGACSGVPGCEVLLIPHNSNLSNGNMFYWRSSGDDEADRTRARMRQRLEPLIEIFQHKGGAECTTGLANSFGATDELCTFEKTQTIDNSDCGDTIGSGGLASIGCVARSDFVRNALALGVAEQQRIGVNPFKLGIIASTDTHNATPGAVSERNWVGHTGKVDVDPVRRLDGPTLPAGAWRFNPGGLMGVWAMENSRDGIFAAMQRRETWGTSGPRIAVRFFGGWGLGADICEDPDLVQTGYTWGVPMGRDLPPGGGQPRFVVSALADPGTAADPGTPLSRLQIVKGWVESDGSPRWQVFDLTRDTGTYALDETSCSSSGAGASSLCGTWVDPDFDASRPAFYYARVLEHASCRWSAFACDSFAPGTEPTACTDPEVPRTVAERAWTSPIWYEPPPG